MGVLGPRGSLGRDELREGARLGFPPAGWHAKGWDEVLPEKKRNLKLRSLAACPGLCGELPTAWVAGPDLGSLCGGRGRAIE